MESTLHLSCTDSSLCFRVQGAFLYGEHIHSSESCCVWFGHGEHRSFALVDNRLGLASREHLEELEMDLGRGLTLSRVRK